MVYVIVSTDSKRVQGIVRAAVHRSNAAELRDGIYFLKLTATSVRDAIVELNMTSEDLDRISLILPSDWAGHASKGFVEKTTLWAKGDA